MCEKLNIIPVGAVSGGEAYLYATTTEAALIDSGYAFCGEELADNIEKSLDGRALRWIILTHSHYDHIGGAHAVKARYPGALIVAGGKTADVLQKTGAITTIRRLNASAAARNGVEISSETDFKVFKVDRTVNDGDVMDICGERFTVYETPGHTRCSISLFCQEKELLFASETLGIPMGRGLNKPGYLVGYQMTIDSIERMRALKPCHILVPHNGLLNEESSATYLGEALYWAREIKNRVVSGYRDGKTEEELVTEFKQLYFYASISRLQVEEAFLLNARIMVSMLLKECLTT